MDRQAADESAIRDRLAELPAGWNAHDGELLARPFADDAEFVSVNGRRVSGRAQIAAEHNRLFAGEFGDSRMRLHVESIRLIRPDVALVDASAAMVRPGERERPAAPGIVLVKDAGEWSIVSFRNVTPVELLPGAETSGG